MTSFAALQSLVRSREPVELCEMCGAKLQHRHQHLTDPVSRRLICSCDACSILFLRSGETKYKSVPRDPRLLPDFEMTDGQWESLLIPIGLAFFLKSSTEGRVHALYPSPAGSTESMLPLDAWSDIVANNPALAGLESDVEALLVNRLDREGEYYLAPIDRCYELVGLIRANWRGLSGGAEVWTKIREFFVELKESAHA